MKAKFLKVAASTTTAVLALTLGSVTVTGTADSPFVITEENGKINIANGEEGYELFMERDNVVVFQDEETEIPDLTGLTPTEHNEYFDGDFFIVDDIYVHDCDSLTASVSATDEWNRTPVTVERSIYDNPDKNYGALYAKMVINVEFLWNGTTAKIANRPACYAYDYLYKLDMTTKVYSYKSDQGSNALFGNKYACVEYVINISNFPKSLNSSETESKDFRLYISMNRNGVRNVEN